MKIIVATEGKSLDLKPADGFARSTYFLIYDTDLESESYILNENKNSPSGAGLKVGQVILDLEADLVLAEKLGKNILEILEAGGIEAYRTLDLSIRENLEAFKENKLERILEGHSGR